MNLAVEWVNGLKSSTVVGAKFIFTFFVSISGAGGEGGGAVFISCGDGEGAGDVV